MINQSIINCGIGPKCLKLPPPLKCSFVRSTFCITFLKSITYTHVYSAKTHYLALRSANTRPPHTPLSPHLIVVSHVPPPPTSSLKLELVPRSSFRISLSISPPRAWMVNLASFLAGFSVAYVAFVMLGFDLDAEEFVLDIAYKGRVICTRDVPPRFGNEIGSDDGC
jgi:hypothetical protein